MRAEINLFFFVVRAARRLVFIVKLDASFLAFLPTELARLVALLVALRTIALPWLIGDAHD
jgi:hypothetical protein